MIDPKKPTTSGTSANAGDFRSVFVGRVHEVLQEGYRRLDASKLAAEEEPSITGELAKSMTSFLRDMSAPEWADNFSVHDDPPVNDDVRKGKRRNRIDIRVDSSTPRPGSSFSVEAKRLGSKHPIGEYLGEEGLGCFLSGDYARDDGEAGMLGYIYSRDADHWAARIESSLRENLAHYEVIRSSCWTRHRFVRGPEHGYVSVHERKAVGRQITIYHSLLLFRNAQSATDDAGQGSAGSDQENG